MFKLEPNPTFFARAEIHVPGQGKGAIEAEFRFLDKAARAAFEDSLGDKSNLEALLEIMVGWREVAAPFTPENLKRLLDTYETSAKALFKAFYDEISGAALKN